MLRPSRPPQRLFPVPCSLPCPLGNPNPRCAIIPCWIWLVPPAIGWPSDTIYSIVNDPRSFAHFFDSGRTFVRC